MSSTKYAETFVSPLTNVELNRLGKVLRPAKASLFLRIIYKLLAFLSDWTEQSYEAWVRRGRPDIF